MAAANSFQCQPPAESDFSSLDEWPHWKCQFEHFQIISGLATKPKPEQVNALIYFMGNKADDLLLSLNLSAYKVAKYEVLSAFESHFVVCGNIT